MQERKLGLVSRQRRPHVAEEYADQGKPDIAYELVRDLRPRSRALVIGTKIEPGEAFSS